MRNAINTGLAFDNDGVATMAVARRSREMPQTAGNPRLPPVRLELLNIGEDKNGWHQRSPVVLLLVQRLIKEDSAVARQNGACADIDINNMDEGTLDASMVRFLQSDQLASLALMLECKIAMTRAPSRDMVWRGGNAPLEQAPSP